MGALMRLAAENYATGKLVLEVRSLFKPQSVLREPALENRMTSMLAAA